MSNKQEDKQTPERGGGVLISPRMKRRTTYLDKNGKVIKEVNEN